MANLAPPPSLPYNKFSPNLALVRLEMIRLFQAEGGSGWNVRKARGSTRWSAHARGAAWDAYIELKVSKSKKREAAIQWLIANYLPLGIQAIHDYESCRVWHCGRGWNEDPIEPSTVTGFGFKRHLHIETHPTRWNDRTPIANRPGIIPPNFDVVMQPTKHPVLRRQLTKPTDLFILSETKVVQKAVGAKQDGWFGEKTELAVKDFQEKHKLYVDGIVGKNTWAKIDSINI